MTPLGLGLGLGLGRQGGGGAKLDPATEAYQARVVDTAQTGGYGSIYDLSLANTLILGLREQSIYANLTCGLFAKTAGRVVDGRVNKLYDLSSNANNVTQTTSTLQPSYTAEGFARYNQVVTTGQADYMSCPHNESLTPANVSFGAWVKLRGAPITPTGGWGGGIISKGTGSGTGSPRTMIMTHDSVFAPSKITALVTRGSIISAATTSNTPSETWAFVFVTDDGTKVRMYFNGVLQSEADTSGSINWGTSIPLFIGNALTELPETRGFNGEIDGVMIFNAALTGATTVSQSSGQVKAIFDLTKAIYGVA